MAKSFSCWVIVADSKPTAFRARQAEDLLPTLRQLQRTQPHVELRWFERGRLWISPESAREASRLGRKRSPARGKDWRPGGSHVDPRAKYQLTRDERRARFKRRLVSKKRAQSEGEGHDTARPRRPKGPRGGRK